MEAPEKIYIPQNLTGIEDFWIDHKVFGDEIEYTRIEAFIEKARKWFEAQNEGVDSCGNYKCDMTDFDDFKKYMKGE